MKDRKPVGGLASIAAAAMLLLAPAAVADRIQLASGDVLTGEILEQTADVVVIEHAILGRLEIPMADVAAIVPEEPEAAPPAEDAPDEPAPDEEAIPAKPAKQWKSQFVLGGNAAFGNSDTQGFNLGVTSRRENQRVRTGLDGRYFYGSSNGERDENRFTAGVLHDWLLPESRWLIFTTARYDYDEFQSWEHRLGAHGGLGYQLYDEEDFELTLRIGAGATKEWGSEDEPLKPEGLLGYDLRWKINDRQELVSTSRIFPDLGDTGEYRTVSGLGWSVLVDPESNMSMHAGVEHEYQSEVDPGTDHNDFRFVAGLQFDF